MSSSPLTPFFDSAQQRLVLNPESDVSSDFFPAEQLLTEQPELMDEWESQLISLFKQFPNCKYNVDINLLNKQLIQGKITLSEVMVERYQDRDDITSIGILARKIGLSTDRIISNKVAPLCRTLSKHLNILDWSTANSLSELAYKLDPQETQPHPPQSDEFQFGRAIIQLPINERQFWRRAFLMTVEATEWNSLAGKQHILSLTQKSSLRLEHVSILEDVVPENLMPRIRAKFSNTRNPKVTSDVSPPPLPNTSSSLNYLNNPKVTPKKPNPQTGSHLPPPQDITPDTRPEKIELSPLPSPSKPSHSAPAAPVQASKTNQSPPAVPTPSATFTPSQPSHAPVRNYKSKSFLGTCLGIAIAISIAFFVVKCAAKKGKWDNKMDEIEHKR